MCRLEAIVYVVLCVNPVPAHSQSNPPLDTKFNIVLSNSREPAGILASFITTASYPCEGYRLQTRLIQKSDTLTVYINGMIRPTPCIQSSSYAMQETFLGDIPGGEHYLQIVYRGQSDIYKLITGENWAAVISIRSTFTDLRSDL
ncbi:MAG: hypothetical protein ABI623_06820 [bacterium]